MWYALVFFCLFLFVFTTVSFWIGKRCLPANKEKSLSKMDTFCAFILTALVIMSGTFFCLIFYPQIPLYSWSLCLGLLWTIFYFSHKKIQFYQKGLLQFALCAAGIAGIMIPTVGFSLSYCIWGLVLSLLWWAGWRLFVFFDRYPAVSNLTSTAWGLALFVVCFVANLPNILVFPAFLLAFGIFIISRIRLSYGLPNLGFAMAQISGFLWAGFWTYCVFNAPIQTLLLVYAYYLMELAVMACAYFQQQPVEPLLISTIRACANGAKAVGTVFKSVFILAFIAGIMIVLQNSANLLIAPVLFFILCFYMYNNLKHIDHPIGGWRDIFSTAKKAVCTLPKASKEMLSNIQKNFKNRSTKKTKKKTAKRKKKK